MHKKFLCIVFMLIAGVCQGQDREARLAHNQALRRQEVTVGTQVWGYSRVYPPLDGLFQDVSAIQVAPLMLDSNASNGASMDFPQQSLQVSSAVAPRTGGSPPSTPSGAVVAAPAAPSSPFSTAPATNSNPSFPATKQMENQIGLLWERMSRLSGL